MNNKSFSTQQNPPLKDYAYLGDFSEKLRYLADKVAEKECWYYEAPNAQPEHYQYGVLFQYIHHTFARAQEEGKLYETQTHSIMNTGLLTSNGEEIYMLFEANRYANEGRQPWFLRSFYRESSRDIPENMRGSLPKTVDYFAGQPEKMFFDVNLPILTNMDHIIDDNFDRLPEKIKAFDKDTLKLLLSSAGEIMRKRISRNYRLVVPQYYNRKIMYLVPLSIGDTVIPMAIERCEMSYRINTVFTRGMAYCNARLLMRPESNWLTNEQPHE
jgi:hypothetical protein